MSTTGEPIRIALADDHGVLREGLGLLINNQPDATIVAEASDGIAAVEVCDAEQPDVAIIDLTMPRASGMWTIKEIKKRSPDTRVLVLTMHDDTRYLRSALAAGASGYVVKSLAAREILDAIRAVHRGRTLIRMSISDTATISMPSETSADLARLDDDTPPLSDRERQVLSLIAHGYTNQEAADILGVGRKSVDSYRARLQSKLGLTRRSEIVRYALDHGILDALRDPKDI